MLLLFVGGCALFVIGLLAASYYQNEPWIKTTKVLASISFVAAGVVGFPLDTRFGQLMLLGLTLGAIGDVYLLGHSTRAFVRGLLFFLFGHLAYICAFMVNGVSLAGCLAALFIAVPAGTWVIYHYWAHFPKKLRVANISYAAVISLMCIFATGTAVASHNAWFSIAAAAFFASEISVTRNHFLGWKFSNILWGLPLYYGAQLIFASLT